VVTFLTPLAPSRRNMYKGSIGHVFTVHVITEDLNQKSFYPFALGEVSVLTELFLGHPRCVLTDVPPQPNSPPESFFILGRSRNKLLELVLLEKDNLGLIKVTSIPKNLITSKK
jgi:hypothetical protein